MKADRIRVVVRFFGPAAEAVGHPEAEYELFRPASLTTLREMLLVKYPALAAGRRWLRFAVNQDYVAGDAELADGDEVAVIPPVAGGTDPPMICLTREPIDLQALVDQVASPECGAIATFQGTVRAEGDANPLVALEYSAYEDMAVNKLDEIRADALKRFEIRDVAIVHRLGRLELGETSVAIAVAAPHRGPAFDACRCVIDTLKKDVPIWKRQKWTDGGTSWVEPRDSHV